MASKVILTLALASGLWLAGSVFMEAASQPFRIEGIVKDENGAPIVGAEVTFSGKSFTATRKTTQDGRFTLHAVPVEIGVITVLQRGFATLRQKWSAQEMGGSLLEFQLTPALISEQVTVTAARTESRVGDTPGSVIVLSSEDLLATSAETLDDTLRQAPGFSLFRRSGSRTANPTSQGVSLRGLGASGASRAAVLADGIPLNDPFGGWIYWGRVPREAISRIEVLRGGASHLYGTDALGGVINVVSHEINHANLSLQASYGNQQTPDISLSMGNHFGDWGARLSGGAFHTRGYRLVDESDRGRIDTPAGSTQRVLDLMLERTISSKGRLFLDGSLFGDARKNGTPLQRNQTYIRQVGFGGNYESRTLGSFSLRSYAGAQVFDQDFSAVARDRNSETLTRSQRVPAQQVGVALQWSQELLDLHKLVGGLDVRAVRGASDEHLFVAGRPSSIIGAGGRQRMIGIFAHDIFQLTPRFVIAAGARIDSWRNDRALSTVRSLGSRSGLTVTNFSDRTETAFSPRLSVLHKLTNRVSLTASGYRAFRAPTLNELYRSFRVGEIVTLANEQLKAERLTGGEAGASVTAFDKMLSLRGVFFWSEITRPISNVTLQVTRDLITRERMNMGRTRSRGLEIDLAAPISKTVTLSGGYQFAEASVVNFPTNRALEGLLIPQVPRHQFTFQARYINPSRLTFGLQGRWIGAQFDDDQNRLRLDRYFVLDAIASRRLGHGMEIFGAAENLFNDRYAIGRTPIKTIGPPVFLRFGLKVHLGS